MTLVQMKATALLVREQGLDVKAFRDVEKINHPTHDRRT
jgi:hypothetical protein